MPRYRLSTDERIHVEVLELGLACCGLEVDAAIAEGWLIPVNEAQAGPATTVLVIAGTLTIPFVEAVLRAHAQVQARGPVSVLTFGACASTGGPYWDAPSVIPGVDVHLPVRWYVPGCPPSPAALAAALQEAAAR